MLGIYPKHAKHWQKITFLLLFFVIFLQVQSAHGYEDNGTAFLCHNCSDCQNALNNNNRNIVYLVENITTDTVCINDPANFSNKIFDCMGNRMFSSTGNDLIYSANKINITVQNCIFKTNTGNAGDKFNIRFINVNNSKIYNNKFIDSVTTQPHFYSIRIQGSNLIEVINNEFKNFSTYLYNTVPIHIESSENISIINNTIVNSSVERGIYTLNSKVNIYNNYIKGAYYGIKSIYYNNINIINNTIISNTFGIESSVQDLLLLENNYICNNADYDIYDSFNAYISRKNNTCIKTTHSDDDALWGCKNTCLNFVSIVTFNEKNINERLYFNLNLFNTTCINTLTNINNITSNTTCKNSLIVQVVNETHNISYIIYNYPMRQYFCEVNETVGCKIDALLLRVDKGVYFTFMVLDYNNNPIPDALVTVKRNLKSSYYFTVAQGKTDTAGSTTMFLDTANYFVEVSKPGYKSINFTINPSPVNQIAYVRLGFAGNESYLMNMTTMFTGINYSIKPDGYYQSGDFDIIFSINASLENLQYFGMNVTYKNLTGQEIVFSENWTNQSGGGQLIYHVGNKTGFYIVRAYFKVSGYDEYAITEKSYFVRPGGITISIEGWSDTTKMMIGIIILILVIGFFSKFNIIAGAIMGLIVLAILTFVIPIFPFYWFVLVLIILIALLYMRVGI